VIHIGRGPKGGVLHVAFNQENQHIWFAGYCRYWVDRDNLMIGGYTCEEHEEFGGPVSYEWDGERFVRGERMPPEGVTVEHGEWLSDEDWKAYCE